MPESQTPTVFEVLNQLQAILQGTADRLSKSSLSDIRNIIRCTLEAKRFNYENHSTRRETSNSR